LAQKLDRKELKKPDEFQLVAGKAMEWAVTHRAVVLGALGAVAVAAIALWAASAWLGSRESKAGASLSAALELEQRPVASEAAPQSEAGPTFPSREERDRAVLAALEKVRADFPRTHAGQTALAEIGFHKLRNGDAAGSQAALDGFVGEAGKDHPLRAFAIESLGYAYEAQGKLDQARDAFARLSQAGAPERAAFQEARLALLENKPDAKQRLEQVAKEYPKDPVALEATQRLEIASLPPLSPPEAQPKPPERARPSRKK
jgi:tetratricopeptide (TPR) repeat protein